MEGCLLGRAVSHSHAAIFCTRLSEPAAVLRSTSLPLCSGQRRWSSCAAHPRDLQSEAQAMAVPWDDKYASRRESGTSEQQPPPLQEQQQRQFAVTQRASKSLKINRDLLLVRIHKPSLIQRYFEKEQTVAVLQPSCYIPLCCSTAIHHTETPAYCATTAENCDPVFVYRL